MPIELIGLISTNDASETHQSAGPLVDPDHTRRFALAHEESDFDRVLIGYSSASPDNLQVAAFAAANTERLGYLVAHRPGVVQPTTAARYFATLDQFAKGRIALHTITGGSEHEQRRDGDFLEKADRYARSEEYLRILKEVWTATEPVDHDGRFYRFEDFQLAVRPYQQPRIPIYFGGSSEDAYRVGGAEADVYALFAQPLDQIAEEIARVRQAADAAGRATPPGISVSFRPILGATEDEAWERAHRILDTTKQRIADGQGLKEYRRFLSSGPKSVGSQRQLDAAARGERHDRALWTPLAAATGAPGNTTALVGTPETVAEALLDYVDLGVTTLLIRGFDPLADAVDYGRELIPRVRAGVAERDAAKDAAAQHAATRQGVAA
ncbi:LLM class flavin-dependent oxidoreductase [Patulibacter minatonensis]|uniref:LLM class flavin-dependent oxidoreductase n=1 Tax=Patulibacter minatonensis TaxID=298163 RepID=UPI00056A09F3|nr:LLM class flavin-dependent oxidoreductase [Patulibacter minatonensis]